ncbi:entericidin [Chitiniphilus purpureus]|uniref:Entericidin n=1 Tax=Chitiniphilus purpureus TaxID=2981137 RepID=A0ABY6DI59_9NEIS|nr:entericidin [Chitiniphilus sp. CD1]UXY14032.1 entericidin [Chitiniphilus sp. CD1]
MKPMLLALLAALSVVTLSACNTMNGFGKDLKKLGDQIEEKSAK